MDEEQANELRRLPEPPAQIGAPRRLRSLREEYGEDIFPVETVLVFHRSGRETRCAVRVAEGMWRLTGAMRLLRWDGLLRKIGHGYEPSVSDLQTWPGRLLAPARGGPATARHGPGLESPFTGP